MSIGIGVGVIKFVIPVAPPVSPSNSVAPVVSGSTPIGSTLTVTPGTWTGDPTIVLTHQWYSGSTPISSQTGTTYVIAEAEGAVIKCRETATNSAGSAYADSNTITATAAPFVPPAGTTAWNTTLTYGGTHTYGESGLLDTITSSGASAKSVMGKITGKWMWEETLVQKVSGRQYAMGMLATSANPAGGQPGTVAGFGYQSTDAAGSGKVRLSGVTLVSGLVKVDEGDTVQCYYDADSGQFEFFVNGVSQGGVQTTDFPGETYYAGHATNGFPTTILRANFGATSSGLQALAASKGAHAGIY